MSDVKRGVAGLLALCVAATGVVAAVGSVAAQDDELVVGVSWNNFQEPRWALWDEPAIKAALEEAGATYVSTDAASNVEKQLTDVEALINQGADALIILAQDNVAIQPAVTAALNAGIPVVAYDRLIEDPGVFYVTFNNVEIGAQQARALLEMVPEGNYAIIKGNAADPNSDFLRAGSQEVLQEALDGGAITIVDEQYTDNWDPAVAQRNMEQILTAVDNDVQAVIAQNDGTAGGVIAALESQGMAGLVPVSGQDADGAALNRIARGTQAQTVWVDAREEGRAAVEAAVAMAGGTAPADLEGAIVFSDGPMGVDVPAILLDPVSITKDNLDVLLEAGWIGQEELCDGVEPGSVAACP